MPLTPEDLERIAAVTLAHYDQGAEDFWLATRDYDVSQNIAALLQFIESTPPFAILDFGCGPGRVITWFQQEHRNWTFFGTDIDAEAIEWAQKNLSGVGTFGCNGHMPPMDYADSFFDFVYSISIFSHLPEDMQNAWLAELHRVTKPGGFLVLTTHGETLVPEEHRHVLKTGFHYSSGNDTEGLPEFYQTSYQSQEYVRREWSRFFTIEHYIVRGLGNHQDLIICRKAVSQTSDTTDFVARDQRPAAGGVRRWLKGLVGNE